MEAEHFSHVSHANTIACLSYAMDSTRLDLLHAISRMYTISLGVHRDAMKCILLVLLGIQALGYVLKDAIRVVW